MADGTHISWSEATWNPITGCTVVSPGCTNCYAMRYAGTRGKHLPSRYGLTEMTKTGPVWNGQVRFNEEWFDQPLHWRKPRMIFVVAHGDLFHEGVPDEWIDRVFAVMALAPQHTFQVLTKRAARMREYMAGIDDNEGGRMEGFRDAIIEGNAQKIYAERTGEDPSLWLAVNLPLPNVWLGVSVEDQKHAAERREDLAALAEQGWLTWVSYEPALGPVDWSGWEFIRWLVAGGESAQNKPGRPAHPDWFRGARDWCQAVDVQFHFKQWGDFAPCKGIADADWIDPTTDVNPICMKRVGAKRAGRLLDGREWNEYPGVSDG